MQNTKPDPPGTGSIVLVVDEEGTSVACSATEVYVICHLFYHALIEIPNCYHAMQLAMAEYKNNKQS